VRNTAAHSPWITLSFTHSLTQALAHSLSLSLSLDLSSSASFSRCSSHRVTIDIENHDADQVNSQRPTERPYGGRDKRGDGEGGVQAGQHNMTNQAQRGAQNSLYTNVER
jgi:hypothetical protein